MRGISKTVYDGNGSVASDGIGENCGGPRRGLLSRLFRRRGKNGGTDVAAGVGAGGKNGGSGDIWLIAGLGNPGAAYEATRHNVGFKTVDRIAAGASVAVQKNRFRSLVGEGRCGDKKIVLIKPQTFMNDSGDAVRLALRFYKIKLENMIVIYDDVDIELGKIRVRAFGGPGSHNGMRSIADHIGAEAKFPRIRIGIGKPPRTEDLREYVLKRFTRDEAELAETTVAQAAAAALDIVGLGAERAMNAHNPQKRGGK